MLTENRVPNDALRTVRAADVATWLTGLGWRQRAFKRPELWVFDGPPDADGQPIVAVIPSDAAYPDFGDRLDDLLRLVAAVTWRPVATLAAELVAIRTSADVPASPEVRTFTGKVVGLADTRASDDDDDDDDGERVVTLRFDANGHGRDQTARLHLDEVDYRAACDAHCDGRPATLRGRLERRGKRWWIVAVEDFAVPA